MMSANRVVWTEGMFLRVQHFQRSRLQDHSAHGRHAPAFIDRDFEKGRKQIKAPDSRRHDGKERFEHADAHAVPPGDAEFTSPRGIFIRIPRRPIVSSYGRCRKCHAIPLSTPRLLKG